MTGDCTAPSGAWKYFTPASRPGATFCTHAASGAVCAGLSASAGLVEPPHLLTPRFSANRTVREYTEQHYLPAAAAYRERAAEKGAAGRQMVDWQHSLDEKWATLRLGDATVETRGEHHSCIAATWLIEALVFGIVAWLHALPVAVLAILVALIIGAYLNRQHGPRID